MLLDRGIRRSYETIRLSCRKHGPGYTRRIRRKARTKDDIWHLGDVVVRINGQKCWLWIAVDHDRYVLGEIVQTRRNTRAARRLLTRLLRSRGAPNPYDPPDGLEGWLRERLIPHRRNADVVRQDFLTEQGVAVGPRTLQRAVQPYRVVLQTLCRESDHARSTVGVRNGSHSALTGRAGTPQAGTTFAW